MRKTPDIQLEIAHLLLIDVVGYSKLSMNEQIAAVEANWKYGMFRASAECDGAKLRSVKMPTGDGMALAFLHESGRTGAMCCRD